jgi:hypothetical protein
VPDDQPGAAAADVEAEVSTETHDASDSVPSGADFGKLYRSHVEREIDPTSAVAAASADNAGEPTDDADATASGTSAEGTTPDATKPDAATEAKPLSRRGAAAKIETLEQENARLKAEADERVTQGIATAVKAREAAERELATRTAAEAEAAKISATEFGDEAEYQSLKSRRAAEDPDLTDPEAEKLARWEINRTRLYPVAQAQITQQWRAFVSERVRALSDAKIPGVDPAAIEAAGEQSVDHLFLAWHAAGAAAIKADLEPKLQAADERAAAAEERATRAENELLALRPQAAGAAAGALPAGTSASAAANGRAAINRQTASADDLIMSGLRNGANQTRRSSR